MESTNTLGIVADYGCFKNLPKPWFDVRSFARRYRHALSGHTLLVSKTTRAILLEVTRELQASGIETEFTMEDLGDSRDALNNIANRKPEELEEILLFLDPKGLLDQLAMMPLEAISAHGHKVRLNFGAALWAEQAWKGGSTLTQQYSEIHATESLVLVEENATIPMFNFIAQHIDTIKLFPQLVVTSSVLEMLKVVFNRSQISAKGRPKLRVPIHPHGELFGVANLIVTDSYNTRDLQMQPDLGARFNVVAFSDYHGENAPGIEMQKFLEVCADPRLRVNLLVNKQTADEWALQFEPPKFGFGRGGES